MSGLDVFTLPALLNNSHRLTCAEQLTQHGAFAAGRKARRPAHTLAVIDTTLTAIQVGVENRLKGEQRTLSAANGTHIVVVGLIVVVVIAVVEIHVPRVVLSR